MSEIYRRLQSKRPVFSVVENSVTGEIFLRFFDDVGDKVYGESLSKLMENGATINEAMNKATRRCVQAYLEVSE